MEDLSTDYVEEYFEYYSNNSTETTTFEFSDYTQRVIVAVLYLIVSVLGTFGNSLVIIAVLLSKKLRTATNAFVVNLSTADLLTCLVIPWNAVVSLGKDGLLVPEWVCSVVAAIQSITIGCSLYTLASIGLQRFLLITRPMSTYTVLYTPKTIAIMLAVTWTIPFLMTIVPPLANVGELGYNKKYHHCGFPSSHPRSNEYDLIIAGGLYPLPLLTIIVCYILIWRHLRRHVKGVSTPRQPETSKATDISMDSVTPVGTMQSSSPSRQGTLNPSKVSRSQNETNRNMLYVVAAFLLCLTPFAVCLFYDDSDPFLPYASVILVLNSCVNPLIYATKHRVFHVVFRYIVRRQWDKIPEPSDFLKAARKCKCCRQNDSYA